MNSKYDHLFETAHLRRNIKKNSLKGGVHVMWSHIGGMIIETLSVMVMARILVPEDFGLIGMVLALTHFAKLFKDLGLSMAVIQQPKITHEQVSLMFWVNVGVGAFLTLAVAASAPLVSWFYGEPRLISITLALSLSFLFSSGSVQHQALLKRQMKFQETAIVYVGAIFLSVLLAVACAFTGMGVWSLVVRNISQPAFYAIGIWSLSPWRPGPFKRGVGGMGMLKFGANITGFNVVNYFSRNLDNILIGKFWGTEQLGYYAQAYKILLFPIKLIRQPFLNVGIPSLSMLQGDQVSYRRYYRNLVSMVAFLSMPLVAFLFVCADAVIYIFLGEQWMPSVRIFRWLSLVAILQPAATAGRGPVMLSLGFGRRYFNLGLVTSFFTVLSFIAGIPWGAVGVARAYVVSNIILTFATTPWCLKDSPVSFNDFLKSLHRSFIASVAAVAAAWVLRIAWLNHHFHPESITGSFVICMGCFAIGLLSGSIVFLMIPGGKDEAKRMFSFLKQVVRPGKSKK